MPKTWDCCNFLNENDLLEIRVNQHWDHVDHFIILEAGQTHTGMPKPFLFDKQRFEKYSSKIIYETIDTVDELLDDLISFDYPIQSLHLNESTLIIGTWFYIYGFNVETKNIVWQIEHKGMALAELKFQDLLVQALLRDFLSLET
jgi:hypothetical protein